MKLSLWQELTRLRDSVEEQKKMQKRIEKYRALGIERLKKQMSAEDCDDPIVRYFVCEHGIIDEKIMELLYKLERRMKGKNGQLFVVSERETKWNWAYYIGLITDERIAFGRAPTGENRCGLPTDGYMEIHDLSYKRNPGPFLFSCGGLPHLDEENNFVLQFEAFIGDEEVFNSLPMNVASRPWRVNLSQAVKVLGKNMPEKMMIE